MNPTTTLESMGVITLLIIALTCITSITAFNNPGIKQQLIFSPYIIRQRKEWYRFVSAGFIHADWIHLILNMVMLYLFGKQTERCYKMAFGDASVTLYIVLYILAIILSEVFNYFRYENFPGFASLGASGAVSAVMFSNILFEPFMQLGFLYFPIKMPGFIFALLYLLFSMQMARQARDNVNHYAHFYGAVFGFIFPIMLKPALFSEFIQKFTYGYH